ncbi:ATP-binding protein [Candidatus Magnetominusculus dajiuhuensis]|uniref:sensor histidine kinase n=1 Tax=Candidatus Magnetominusculus dajiuhuensis TaxID=3137712 RepID=UPI003B433FE6
MKNPFALSLNKKLIAMMLILTCTIIFMLVMFNLQLEHKLLQQVERQTGELTKAIQVGVEEVTGKTGESRLSQYLTELNKRGIKEISIISNNSEIVASTNQEKIGRPISHKRKEMVIKAELGEHVSDEGKTYNVIVPVVADGQQYGYIHLMINKDDFSDLIKMNTVKRTFTIILVFGTGLLIALVFSRRVTLPIKRLADASLRVSAGDLTQQIEVKTKDEVGQLSESFNYMVKKLSESRNLEERLREAEHLSGLGKLSRDMAHEIKNPLNFISLSIDYISGKYPPEDKDKLENFNTLVVGIKHEIRRLNNLVNDFLEFSRTLKISPKMVQINDVLEDVVALVWAKAEADGIVIIKNYCSDMALNVDADLFKSCVLNVITNAFQAINSIKSTGGLLKLTTEVKESEFILTIEDDGPGVPAENLPKLFEPFFSTKQNHPGLGLPMTFRVMEEHGGRVEFYSEPGAGSEVKLFLPCPCESSPRVGNGKNEVKHELEAAWQ